MLIEIAKIKLDGGTQSRAELSGDTISEYAEEMAQGCQFPSIDVFYDGSHYWLVDGFHRVNAAHIAAIKQIEATIHQGDHRAAILWSVGANHRNGLRRTNDDKRQAIMRLLTDNEWCSWSDREIARRCGVDHEMVGRLRRELSGGERHIEDRTVTRGGTTYKMSIAGITRAAKLITNKAIKGAVEATTEALVTAGHVTVDDKQVKATPESIEASVENRVFEDQARQKQYVVDNVARDMVTKSYKKVTEFTGSVIQHGGTFISLKADDMQALQAVTNGMQIRVVVSVIIDEVVQA